MLGATFTNGTNHSAPFMDQNLRTVTHKDWPKSRGTIQRILRSSLSQSTRAGHHCIVVRAPCPFHGLAFSVVTRRTDMSAFVKSPLFRIDNRDQLTVFGTLILGIRLTSERAASQLADDRGILRGRNYPSQGFVRCKINTHIRSYAHCRGYHTTIEGEKTAFFSHDFERHPPHSEVFGRPSGMLSGRVQGFC